MLRRLSIALSLLVLAPVAAVTLAGPREILLLANAVLQAGQPISGGVNYGALYDNAGSLGVSTNPPFGAGPALVNVRTFGAHCDGTIHTPDDTTALQNAINAVDISTGGATLLIPGTCEISSTLTAATTSSGFGIVGANAGEYIGLGVSAIVQNTNNIPVLQFTASNAHHVTISNLSIGFASAQSSSSTGAIGIEIGAATGPQADVYLSEFNNLLFFNAFRGIQVSATGTFWGSQLDRIIGGGSLSGATFARVAPTIQGDVTDSFSHFYSSQSISEPQYIFGYCQSCIFDTIESNEALATFMTISAVQGVMRNLHVESLYIVGAGAVAVSVETSKMEFVGIDATANVSMGGGSGGSAYFIQDTNASSNTTIDRVQISMNVISGNVYLIDTPYFAGAGDSTWDVGSNIVLSGMSLASSSDPAVISGMIENAGPTRYTNPIGQAQATSSANVNSDSQYDQGNFWNGSGSGLDIWTRQVVEGTGTNPTSTYTFSHSGSSGGAALAAPMLETNVGYTIGGTLPAAGSAGRRAYVVNQLTACPVPGAALTSGGSVVCPVFDNGTAWVGG